MNIDFVIMHKSYKKLVLHSQTHSQAQDLIACSLGAYTVSNKTLHVCETSKRHGVGHVTDMKKKRL